MFSQSLRYSDASYSSAQSSLLTTGGAGIDTAMRCDVSNSIISVCGDVYVFFIV